MRYTLNQLNFDTAYTPSDFDYDLDILEICFLDQFVARRNHKKMSKKLMNRFQECSGRVCEHLKDGYVIGVEMHVSKNEKGKVCPPYWCNLSVVDKEALEDCDECDEDDDD